MFRNLILALADRFHLVAPDYPGFGHSAFPPADEIEYSFANLTRVVERFIEVVGLERFSIYIQDYGAPIGLSIASARPERVQAIITQSGNAYMDGFTPFWEPLFAYATDPSPENEAKVRPLLTPEANVWQWTHGTRDPQHVDPDLPALDTLGFDRPLRARGGARLHRRADTRLPSAQRHVMRLLSVNVGLPQDVPWNGRVVR